VIRACIEATASAWVAKRAARCAVHGDFRARRHHRAELDPAGRFHSARQAPRPNPARGAARGRRRTVQAHPAYRPRSDDRSRHHPARPHLPRPGNLTAGLASSTLLTVLVIPAIYVVLRDDGDVPKFDWRPPACHHLGRRDEAAGDHRTARWRGGGVAAFSRAVAAHGQVLARRKVQITNQ
jgi:hypothetical protein